MYHKSVSSVLVSNLNHQSINYSNYYYYSNLNQIYIKKLAVKCVENHRENCKYFIHPSSYCRIIWSEAQQMRIIYWYTDILQQLKQQTKRKKNTF